MVRGRCPRDMIRVEVDGGRRTVSNAGAIGHAERVHPTRPGGLAATVHRGRCTLRWVRNKRCGAYGNVCGFPRASQKVRGLCPRYYIRWTVEVTVRTVGNTGAIGHAGHPRQRCPGNPATAAHRGRCALRAGSKTNVAAWNVTDAGNHKPSTPPTSRLR